MRGPSTGNRGKGKGKRHCQRGKRRSCKGRAGCLGAPKRFVKAGPSRPSPVAGRGDRLPEIEPEAPDLPAHVFAAHEPRTTFDDPWLPIEFQWLRSPLPEELFSLTARRGYLRLFEYRDRPAHPAPFVPGD